MSVAISKSEKLDIFLALAMFHMDEVDELADDYFAPKRVNKVLESFSSMDNSDQEALKERAQRFEKLEPNKQKVWQTFWMEKLRGLGQTRKLDENIHPEHIAEVLENESSIVRTLIYQKLPEEVQDEITELIPDSKDFSKNENIANEPLPTEEIWLVIRKAFLSNFIAVEDIYKSNDLDHLSIKQLEKFVWDLGVRETAISCRGIKTKENLAVFLKPFDERTTKEIANKIKGLEDIDPNRVVRSETIVRESFQAEEAFENKLIDLGLQLLSITLVQRDNNAKQYTTQKLPKETSKKLKKFIDQFEIQFEFTDQNKRAQFEELAAEINELAVKFKELEK